MKFVITVKSPLKEDYKVDVSSVSPELPLLHVYNIDKTLSFFLFVSLQIKDKPVYLWH